MSEVKLETIIEECNKMASRGCNPEESKEDDSVQGSSKRYACWSRKEMNEIFDGFDGDLSSADEAVSEPEEVCGEDVGGL